MNDKKFTILNCGIENFYKRIVAQLSCPEIKINRLLKNYEKYHKRFQGTKLIKDFWQVKETINELVVASKIFERYPHLEEMQYELIPGKIDFTTNIGNQVWLVEVKSINPDFDQAKNKIKYKNAIDKKLIPHNIHHDFDEESFHDSISARSNMLNNVIEFERKIKNQKPNSASIISTTIVFCTNKASFTKTDLQDFALNYKESKYFIDDNFSEMEAHDIKERQISFLKNINEFAFLKEDFNGEYSINWSA